MNYVREEAERIKKNKPAGKGSIRRLDLKLGDNLLRLMPCWAAHGRLFRKEAEHWQLAPGMKHYPCLLATWPAKTDRCPICDAMDKVLAMFPELSLDRQQPSSKYTCNVIERAHEDKGVQVVRFTPAVYNWITAEMSSTAGDVADIDHGVDLKIVVKMEKRKDGVEQKKYVPSWIPRQTLLSDRKELAELWMSQIYDLDKIKQYPSDERLGEIHTQATAMIAYYIKKYKQDADEGRRQGSTDEHPPHTDEDAPPKREPTRRSSPRTEVAKPEDTSPVKATKRETPKKPPSSLAGVDPKGMPACFAGLEVPECHDGNDIAEHIRGTFGFNEELMKCLICEHELRCRDIKEDKGL
jgi:hypothetical protein